MSLDLTPDQIRDLKAEAAAQRWEERALYFERVLAMTTDANARIGKELGEVKHDLRQANVLADRYHDLLCTIVRLADQCEEIPRDVVLVVQEARSVTSCE